MEQTLNKKTPVFWVEDWPMRSFFLESYMQVQGAQKKQEIMDLIWGLVYKMLIAREATEKKINLNKKNYEANLKSLLKEDYIQDALNHQVIDVEDIEFFLTIEGLYENFIGLIRESIVKDIQAHPEKIEKIYHQQENMDLKNVYEIFEAIGKNTAQLNLSVCYSETDLLDQGYILSKLGLYPEEEIKRTFVYDEVPLLGKNEGSVIPADLENEDKLYYWIKKRWETYKREYKEVQQEFEEFVSEYLLRENLEEIYEDLMDKYTIKYNEEYLNKLLKE